MKSVVKMKMFRVVTVLVCGAGLVVGAAVAQQDAPPPPSDSQQQGPPPGGHHRGWDPERRSEMMQKRLDLTADQTSQIKAILVDAHAKMEAMHDNTSMAREERHTQGEAMHHEVDAKIRAVLNPEQTKKFDEMQERQKERRERRGGDMPAPPAPAAPPAPPAPQR